MSAWAPLVPLVKTRLGLSDSHLGLLLLCPGIGLFAAMPVTGALTGRYGARRVAPIAGAAAACTLPALASLDHIWLLGLVLVLFGAAGGMTDVAMNVHAILVERTTGRAMMSSFHGLWSVGCVAGAGLVTLMLASGLTPVSASIVVSASALLLLAVSRPLMLPGGGEPGGPALVMPHGIVLLMGVCCAVLFLAEASVQDWSGVLLTTARGVEASHAGVGYVAFASAMTICRLVGDPIVRGLGPSRVVVLGSLTAAGGFMLAALAPYPSIDIMGYGLVGIGAANVVPVMFSAAGRQTVMPGQPGRPRNDDDRLCRVSDRPGDNRAAIRAVRPSRQSDRRGCNACRRRHSLHPDQTLTKMKTRREDAS